MESPVLYIVAGECLNCRHRLAENRPNVPSENERFIRWQNNTLTQFGAVNNLLIGLAVAALGFHLQFPSVSRSLSFWIPAIGFAGSAAVGVWCAFNRLRDFRDTAQIANDKMEPEDKKAAREEVAALGKQSWRLLYLQAAAFGVGAIWKLVSFA